MKILNADDKVENQYLIEALFRGHGHEVVSVPNGEAALAAATTTAFDVLVSDLLMPRMDGFQLIREIRARPELSRLPIVVYTATYTDPKDEALVLNLGANCFLRKPAETEALLAAVEQVVQQRVKGAPAPGAAGPTPAAEAVVLKEYNARLIAKLEKKMQDLDAANLDLKATLEQCRQAEAERRRIEEQLRHAQKMEAIGTLAGGIAHDFNNILTGIMCAAELGLADVERPEATKGYFSGILSASARARDLVKQILAFSRQQPIERRPLDLKPLVSEAVKFLRSSIPSVVALETDLSGKLPAVLADPTQIHQLLTNLCTNAWHAVANRENARISIRLDGLVPAPDQLASCPDLRPVPYVRLTVSDNGCGMDPATMARMYDPFFTTKPPGVGTGLGLSVVHGIMRACDGAILAQSELGQGACFQLFFPALETPPREAAAPAAQIPRGHGQRILFVDDEAMLANLGGRMLRNLGYQPLTFTDPLQAIEAFRDQEPAAVLVDFSMPGLNGVELAHRVLTLNPNTPLILMTGFSATLESGACAKYFKGLLLKPYTLASLACALRQALNPPAE